MRSGKAGMRARRRSSILKKEVTISNRFLAELGVLAIALLIVYGQDLALAPLSEMPLFAGPVRGDFSLSVSPSSLVVPISENAVVNVKVSVMRGYNQSVSLIATGAPKNVTVTFLPSSGMPPFTSNMTVNASLSARPGKYVIVVEGRGADGRRRFATLRLDLVETQDTRIRTILAEGEGVATAADRSHVQAVKKPAYQKVGSDVVGDLQSKRRERVIVSLKGGAPPRGSFAYNLTRLKEGDKNAGDSFRVRYKFDKYNMIVGYATIDAVNAMEDDAAIESVRKPLKLQTFRSESAQIMGITEARSIPAYSPQGIRYVNGSGFNICLLDSGVDYTHPELKLCNDAQGIREGCIVKGYDFVNGDADPKDDYGHGTFVAGIIHAAAPASKIIAVKMSDKSGNVDEADIYPALQWCDDNRATYGITAVSMSWGAAGYWRSYCPSNGDSFFDSLYNHGIFMAAATGNDGSTSHTSWPACRPDITSVGAVNKTGFVWEWTSRHAASVDLMAIGVNVISTYPGGYALWNGTSFSTPFVSASAALLRQYYSFMGVTKTADEIRSIFRATGDPVTDGTNWWPQLNLTKAFYAVTCVDGDSDTFNSTGLVCGPIDCSDSDSSVYPGAPEICDGKDNDCNSRIDEGCNDDNDDYCDANMPIIGTPPICTAGGGDCNDNDEVVYPGAPEICDGQDNDCNGQVDEGCDKDKDYFCDINMVTVGAPRICPYGGNDCDDSDASFHPVPTDGLIRGDTKLCPGTYLGRNLFIHADNITLDCNGAVLNRSGITSTYHNNITLKNCIITGSGISISEGNNFNVSSNTVYLTGDSGSGIVISFVRNSSVTDNILYSQGVGISMTYSENIIVRNNKAYSNNLWGIITWRGTAYNITENEVYSNGGTGGPTVVSSSGGGGIALGGSTNSYIGYNKVYSNKGQGGIRLDWGSINNTVIGNNVSYNSDHGIFEIFNSGNNTISSNNVYANNRSGILLDLNSSANIVEMNNVTNNANGITIYTADNKLYNNILCSNRLQDISKPDWLTGNSGDDNTCTKIFSHWNDDGTTGCTYPCP